MRNMFDIIRKRHKYRKHRRVVKSLREQLSFFGCDVSNLTDTEIEHKITELSKFMSSIGMTTQEAADSLYLLSAKSKLFAAEIVPPNFWLVEEKEEINHERSNTIQLG